MAESRESVTASTLYCTCLVLYFVLLVTCSCESPCLNIDALLWGHRASFLVSVVVIIKAIDLLL